MSNFLEEVRGFLRGFVRHPAVDEGRCRQRFLAALEQREVAGEEADWLRRRFEGLNSHLTRFCEDVSLGLAAAGIPLPEIPDLVDEGIALALDLTPSAATRTRALVLHDVVNRVRSAHGQRRRDQPWRDIGRYAREIRAVRRDNGHLDITPLGRMVVELSGREAVRWLLHVEATLAAGPHDPWRIDRSILRHLVRKPEEELFYHSGEHFYGVGYERLQSLGVLFLFDDWDDDDPHSHSRGYSVHEHAMPILQEVAGGESPMATLVAAMLEDEIGSHLPVRQVPQPSAAVLRQARLVVHELRNAIIPVQIVLGEIDRAIEAAGIEARVADSRRRVDAGLERLLALATEFDTMARAAGEIPEMFDIGSAIREAMSLVSGELGSAPRPSLPPSLPLLHGIRGRFVRALVNLVRNAYQAAPAGAAEVAVTVEAHDQTIQIAIDDNGPGVPDTERETIFRDGFSTRPAGTGHGLAFARETVVQEMHGTLVCEDSRELGGARFVIAIPVSPGDPT
ncbi:ATP-binding protein [Haliangium sp.]|uniref:ATP-binding protein n=1 Tax=Haliangium sp. TaxID=2663208 RepID=UPI003D0AEC37